MVNMVNIVNIVHEAEVVTARNRQSLVRLRDARRDASLYKTACAGYVSRKQHLFPDITAAVRFYCTLGRTDTWRISVWLSTFPTRWMRVPFEALTIS